MSNTTNADFWCDWLATEKLVWASRLTAGIYAVIRIRGAKRVVVPNNCCLDIVYAILLAEAEPVFCEINLSNGGLDAEACEILMQTRVDMVIHVHLYGLYSDRKAIHQLCDRHGVFFFEDGGLWFPPVRGYEPLENSCLGLSFGGQKIFDLGGGAVLSCRDRSLAIEIQRLLASLPPRRTGRFDYSDVYYSLIGADGLPKKQGTDFSVLANRYRSHWIGSGEVPHPALDASTVASSRAIRVALREKYTQVLEPLGAQFFAEHPLDMPWRFSFLSNTARRSGIASSHWYPPLDMFFPTFRKSRTLADSYRLGAEVCNLLLNELSFEESLARLRLATPIATEPQLTQPFRARVQGWLGSISRTLKRRE